LKYFNEKSKEKIEYLNEIRSRIVQHELEHLDGISFLENKVNLLKTINIDEVYKTDEIFEKWYYEQKQKNYLIT
jgi:peptide deformylase